jgi:hypothetical protein
MTKKLLTWSLGLTFLSRSERTWLELFVREVKEDIVDLPEDIFELFTCCGSYQFFVNQNARTKVGVDNS